MNVLFVCFSNQNRSRTAEIHFQNKYPQHRFRSAGINKYLSERHGGIHLKRYMLEVADIIVCMEHCHAEYIMSKIDKVFLEKIEIICLGDTEQFMSESLITQLEEKFRV